MNIKFVLIIFCIRLMMIRGDISSNFTQIERSKRQINSLPLIYPYGAVSKFIISLSVPIDVSDDLKIGFSFNLQFQYGQFDNITQLSQYYFIKTVSREQRELDWWHRRDERLMFYRAFGNLIEARGLNGQQCMLRAICEAAQFPVEEEGFIGEIMHILLTPDYGRSRAERDPYWTETMSDYLDAVTAGRQMFHCPSIYTGCPEGQGFLELVTMLGDE